MDDETEWEWQFTAKAASFETLAELLKGGDVELVGDIINLRNEKPKPVVKPVVVPPAMARRSATYGSFAYGSRTREAADKKQCLIDALKANGGKAFFSELQRAFEQAGYNGNAMQSTLDALVPRYVNKIGQGLYEVAPKDEETPDDDDGEA